jgi:hypothetical protein
MENLINEYVEAIQEYKKAWVAFDLCEERFAAVATLNLKAAETKLQILHKKLKGSGELGKFEATFRTAAWRNIAAGIGFCDRTV